MTENEKLAQPKPCPFCGQIPTVSHGKVKCLNLECLVQPKTRDWFTKGYYHEAVNDWNVRVG
mgnify:CR=1 FL=1